MKHRLIVAIGLATFQSREPGARSRFCFARSIPCFPNPADAAGPDAETTKAELAELHRIEARRTEAEVARAKFDDENENIFCSRCVGDKFTKEIYP